MNRLFVKSMLMLIVAGVFACKKENDIDMSEIDFSNIENLYAQPLPVIQKAVQGKWKVYEIASDGIWYNAVYPENMYIEIKTNYYLSWEPGKNQDTVYFTWKKMAIEDWRNPLNGQMAYVMWTGDRSDNWYVDNIHNDTLYLRGHFTPVSSVAVKIK